MTDPELEPLQRARTAADSFIRHRRQEFGFILFVLFAGAVVVGVSVVFGLIASSKFSDIQEVSRRVEANTELLVLKSRRDDCRTAISSARNDVLGDVGVAGARANEAQNALFLAAIAQPGQPLDPTITAAYADANAALTRARDAAERLPKVNDVIDHGGMIGTTMFAACPRVKSPG